MGNLIDRFCAWYKNKRFWVLRHRFHVGSDSYADDPGVIFYGYERDQVYIRIDPISSYNTKKVGWGYYVAISGNPRHTYSGIVASLSDVAKCVEENLNAHELSTGMSHASFTKSLILLRKKIRIY